ncbi:hypothetical protein METBIDRAFT_33820 [Metschnikowia bicuspidata var. bicuspidata NRRL YB-4993]|uniref:PH domain-containing protein n=1 Tax=Metschnikowia bicuspidata var. bicuspidata NRRL YB-4993 TaxID=869754 RepID=A0A1A0GZ67_9ASCO|nr:hypothetical protein METBIDRAFT_33820 [Metschnikowia bicuspidata var. bicuspidata NRRL YB-4993]OBA16985.1 hypothetical protein METBIDRAFT_33820 [Metschnikowia bicuspidata var. bicuspidata NRRL YB-4993]
MAESSRTINHRLNELLSEGKASQIKLDVESALKYSDILKQNILGKDKQEKVNSIVVFAKLLDCVSAPESESVSPDFQLILDESLFDALFSIVSMKMSAETYRAILKIALLSISGGMYPSWFGKSSIDIYLPIFQSLVTYLDVIDVMTAKLYTSETKVVLSSIYLVNELIEKALQFSYDRIITLSGRLKHVKFFFTITTLEEVEEAHMQTAISALEKSYLSLNEYLSKTRFHMSLTSHQVMLTNLFVFLDVSLNEFGTPASTEEYVKAGFTADPKTFVTEKFTILLAMDLKVFLKDPNMAFKKKFHEELIMSDHNRTFPLYLFISECTKLWLDIFYEKKTYPRIASHILSWELMIYYSMNNCLSLWQETNSVLENSSDIKGIIELLKINISILENSLAGVGNIEESLEDFTKRTTTEIRREQFDHMKSTHALKWAPRFKGFDKTLAKETIDFVCEQRVMQLLKGSWVHTEAHADRLFDGKVKKSISSNYYFIMLSPNRRLLHYKEFSEVTTLKPTLEEMESQSIALKDISELKSIKIGNLIGEDDKAKSDSLISVKGTISYEKIILWDRHQKTLLSFYTNSEDKKAVWLDGLKMLKGLSQEKDLSKETAQQLTSLQEIRKNTQLLVLESKDFEDVAPKDEVESDDSEEYYDLDELTSISENFHFE